MVGAERKVLYENRRCPILVGAKREKSYFEIGLSPWRRREPSGERRRGILPMPAEDREVERAETVRRGSHGVPVQHGSVSTMYRYNVGDPCCTESICNSRQPLRSVPDYSQSGVDWEILARSSRRDELRRRRYRKRETPREPAVEVDRLTARTYPRGANEDRPSSARDDGSRSRTESPI